MHDWTPEQGETGAFCTAVLIETIMQVLRDEHSKSAAETERLRAVAQVNAAVTIT